ncbi:LysE family translocator [Pseudoroseicyclus tamaricis]|uniref:LysE family translocator n=1 Tax=Pseudoroseicyclus tamaricis TaxID=2705421 RepID=A0A6B2JVH8_9RHOB|nr:LysE family translocator [Pseudoroseicyclus tamaricis]NDV01895.1 LysE family translocator [Pseudoroseicyclus tamaricis]
MDIHVWLAFVAASILLLALPGPTVLMVLSYALSQGRRVALAMVAGVALGDLLAMSASLLGLGALMAASATLFTIFKVIGGLYLLWLGFRLLREPPAVLRPEAEEAPPMAPGRIFGHAALVTALNPKSIAFFVAFVPQFLSPAAPVAPQAAILIATFVGLAAVNSLLYALLADGVRTRLARPRLLLWVSRAGGAALMAMGLLTLNLKRAA